MVTTPIERLLKIDWQLDDTRSDYHTLLFLEYLRRMALWAQLLNCGNEWPFFDITTYICPQLEVPELDINILTNHLAQYHLNTYVQETCIWYLRWVYYSIGNTPPLPDPYEPLITMYEQGERFYTEHGFIYLSQTNISISRQHWQVHISNVPRVELNIPHITVEK